MMQLSRHIGLLLAALLLLSSVAARADQYAGNGNTGYGGAIGKGTLALSDDGTNISGTLTVGGSMNDVLVLYLQSGPGGFADTSGFNDQGDACRQAISGVSASGRSLLTFASTFQPNYAIALAPAVSGMGGLYQLANGGSNSLVCMGSVNLAPLNNIGPYTFSFPGALIGMIPGVRSTIQVFGTYIRADGSRSTEAIAGDLNGSQGWNPFTQSNYATYTFAASAVLVKLPLGVWAQRLNPPSARAYHTAIWSGTEMIVWGGQDSSGYMNDSARYSPVANTWTVLPTTGAPSARAGHTAVWTGSEMIVWGGYSNAGYLYYNADGGRYSPAANSWTVLATTGAPTARAHHTAVWTGSEMIVYGGNRGSSTPLADGGRYDPTANTWTALPTNGAPAARAGHTAVWTGSEMIIWGGYTNATGSPNRYADGGRYSPAANCWTALATTGAPAARGDHTAVWTGIEMIIWGGYCYSNGWRYLNDGRRYNPSLNGWTAVQGTGAPAARAYHTAAWTGGEMIVWGGYAGTYLNTGGRYDPAANNWTALPAGGAPGPRELHTAVWTGSEMIVWGGYSGSYLNSGGRYNPVTSNWTALPVIPTPPALRYEHTAVWTGIEMIIWGGYNGSYLGDGGRYSPAANSWTVLPTTGAPAPRTCHSAVWTGGEMIIWGGCNGAGYLNDGGRYNPTANGWTTVPTVGAPAARAGHTAVWTGTEMIMWGGYDNVTEYADGGRFNLETSNWTALPADGAPSARCLHTAVWTGSEMIIWGGRGDGYVQLGDGARYNPMANSWGALAITGAPAARESHTAVWTGSEMIVWGGYNDSTGYLNDGARYNALTDNWADLSVAGAPHGRIWHTAVWTGTEMIVWAGSYNGGYLLNDGGRYNPGGNAWTALSGTGAPASRIGHTAVWTGSEMIVFGGNGTTYLSDTWSYYPYAPAVRLTRSSPTSADVAWPVWNPTLRLCQSSNLSAGQWTTVTNAVTQVGSENHVTVSPLNGSQFFRAEYP